MTDDVPPAAAPAKRRVIAACVVWCVILFLLLAIVGWLDDTTELTPSHEGVWPLCLAFAGVSAALCAGLAARASSGLALARRVVISLAVGFAVFVAMGAVSLEAAEIIEGAVDFPSRSTVRYEGLLSISRAYQTHGKGRSWNIQTMPIWSNLDITEADYQFMLAHRRPGDSGRDPDEVSSDGYFCARVTLERSGAALRVLHAGTHKLPRGTVVVCPSAATNAARASLPANSAPDE